jgi:Flp pilus assembly protein TadG
MKPKKAVMRTLRKHRERGSAIVEFALISTVLMMMTLGVADFGRIIAYGDKAFAAALAGTAYGALDSAHYSNLPAMQDVAMDNLAGLTGATVVATRTCRCSIGGIAVDCDDPNCAAGESRMTYVGVEVNIPFRRMSPVPMMASILNVKGKHILRVE